MFFVTQCAAAPSLHLRVPQAHCVSQWGHGEWSSHVEPAAALPVRSSPACYQFGSTWPVRATLLCRAPCRCCTLSHKPPAGAPPPDFRKDYTKLCHFKQRFPDVPILALTATATPRVEHDVVALLGIRQCLKFRSSFNRPNLGCAAPRPTARISPTPPSHLPVDTCLPKPAEPGAAPATCPLSCPSAQLGSPNPCAPPFPPLHPPTPTHPPAPAATRCARRRRAAWTRLQT